MTIVVLLLLIGLIAYIFNGEIHATDPVFLVEHVRSEGCGTTLLLLIIAIVLMILSLFS